MGWASGFATGTNMARQWIDTYNQANTQRELKALDEERKRGLGRPATLDELNAANAETNRLQREDTDTFGLTPDEQAKFNNRKVESGTVGLAPMSQQDYYSRKAAVYNKYGNHQMADQLDQRAYQMGRDAEADRRWGITDARAGAAHQSTMKTQEQQQKLTGLQIDVAEQAAADTKRWNAFSTARSNLENPDDLAAVNALAKQHLNYDQQLKLVGNMTQMGEHKAKLLAQSITEKVERAGNLSGLAIAFRDDPDLDPGSYFDYRTDPKTGKVQVQFFNADKSPRGTPIQYRSEAEAYYSLGKSAVDPASIYTFLREQEDRALNRSNIESQISARDMEARAKIIAAQRSGGSGGVGGLKFSDVPHITKTAAQAAQMWAKYSDGGTGLYAVKDADGNVKGYRTTPELDDVANRIAMDMAEHGKMPTPEAIVEVMRRMEPKKDTKVTADPAKPSGTTATPTATPTASKPTGLGTAVGLAPARMKEFESRAANKATADKQEAEALRKKAAADKAKSAQLRIRQLEAQMESATPQRKEKLQQDIDVLKKSLAP